MTRVSEVQYRISQYRTHKFQLTKTIFVSSNSCCILIIVSACFGSWYFDTYVWISGKLIAEGWLNDDWGTLPIKSSRTLVRMEKAGRTGYSWSVIMTAESMISISTQKVERIAHQPTVLLHPDYTHVPRNCSPEHSVAVPVVFFRRQSWTKIPWIPLQNLSGKTKTATDQKLSRALSMVRRVERVKRRRSISWPSLVVGKKKVVVVKVGWRLCWRSNVPVVHLLLIASWRNSKRL